MDNPTDSKTVEVTSLLNSLDCIQHVSGPTHKHGHTLDLIISHGLDIKVTQITDVAMSDHYCVFFEMSLCTNTMIDKRTVTKRYFTDDSVAVFMDIMLSLPPLTSSSCDTLVENFNFRLTDCINTVAPLKTKTITGKVCAPWRNTDVILKLKRECRAAERKWRSTRLTVHQDIYKNSLKKFNVEMKLARRSYFSKMIDDHKDNPKFLFSTIDRLINSSSHISSELLSVDKCNEFAVFFSNKVTAIRDNIENTMPHTLVTVPPHSGANSSMSDFSVVDFSTLNKVISLLKSSSCPLDPIPTDFFKLVLSSISIDVLNIVNQ